MTERDENKGATPGTAPNIATASPDAPAKGANEQRAPGTGFQGGKTEPAKTDTPTSDKKDEQRKGEEPNDPAKTKAEQGSQQGGSQGASSNGNP